MKFFVVLSVLFAAASADVCYNDVLGACRPTADVNAKDLPDCNAKYGLFSKASTMETDLQGYVNAQVQASFEFLLMSTHFGNYQVNRDGFKALYRKLSDKAWDDAFDLINYIARRGGKMNFNVRPSSMKTGKDLKLAELNELNSLAKALDTQKILSEESIRLHSYALRHNEQDGSVSHYLEERFLEPQAETVRNLAGHITDLKQLVSDMHSASVSLFIFDEYLHKHV